MRTNEYQLAFETNSQAWKAINGNMYYLRSYPDGGFSFWTKHGIDKIASTPIMKSNDPKMTPDFLWAYMFPLLEDILS